MSTVTQPITYADLLEMPDVSGNRYEIIGGELFVTASPSTAHQFVSFRLTRSFDQQIVQAGRGFVLYAPTDVKLSEYDVVVPDLLIITADRRGIIQDNYIGGPPDLIVEIPSPSTRRVDLLRKSALYATMGVREYWLVDLKAKAIEVLTLDNGVYQSTPQGPGSVRSLVFPNLTVDLGTLFEDIS